MKDLYAFLDDGQNFFGFIVCLIIIFSGLSSITYNLTKNWGKNKKTDSTKKPKQPLHD